MIKKNLLKILSIAALIVTGCNEKTNDNYAISVDIDNVTSDSLDIAEFINSLTYIELQTPSDEIIGNILSARIKDSHIIIKDNTKDSPVALFDQSGNFISRVGQRGQGPGDYIEATAVDIDTDTIYIYDMRSASALMYNTHGQYLGKDSIGYGYDFAVTRIDGKKYYLLANYNTQSDDMAGIFLITPKPFKSEKILDRRDELVLHNRPAEFSFNNDIVRTMTNDYEFKAMRLDYDSTVCEYEFDISPIPPRSEINSWTTGYDNLLKHFTRTAYIDADRWIYLFFSKIDNPRSVLFDKKNNTYQVARYLKNSLDDTSLFWFQPTVVDGILLGVTIPDDDKNPRIMLAHLKK